MLRSLAIGVLWLVAAAAANAQPWPSFCVHPIARGETASGQLANTDCNWFYNSEPGNRYYLDVYSFDGTVGQGVSIELKSSAFDAYVKLHDVNEFASLPLVANDNGGGGTNARIPAGSGTYTLPKTGTYYIWASSVAPNAFGAYTLTLNGAVVGPPPAAPNYQGLWWNPLESGWGINFAHQSDIIFATWFTYDAGGKPWWLIAELHKSAGGVYSGPVSTVTGPPFNAVPFVPAPVETVIGTMTATFADTQHATLAYTVNGVSRSKSIVPQQFGTLPVCAWGTQPNLALATNYTDLWWNAAESGWGINFTHQGDIIFATWFTYDTAGKPWWLIAELHKVAPGVYTGVASTVTGPPYFAVPFDPGTVVETPVGNATVTFAHGNSATLAYTVNGASRSKAITRQVFALPGTVCQ